MCSIYSIKTELKSLAEHFDAEIADPDLDFKIPDRIYPRSFAPVLIKEKEKLFLKPMHYSLVPHWSKDIKQSLKYATYNARIETISEKPAFRDAFKRNHCLVPLTEFYEPIYTGEYAGFMVKFAEKGNSILTVAGIYDSWKNKETGETLNSFAIITDQPLSFIAEIGHPRSPIFVNQPGILDWLEMKDRNADMHKESLKNIRQIPNLVVERDRELKNKKK